MPKEHHEFYDNLNEKISNWLKSKEGREYKWRNYIKYTPHMFKLICNLSLDKNVDDEIKGKLAPVVAYFVSPFDHIPEEIWGAVGFSDDLILSALILKKVYDDIDDEIIDKYWDSEEQDLQELVNNINDSSDQMIEKKYLDKLVDMVE
ncbi:MAG: DUF1232 domain-containing protein [Candidatus Marinimicrobia bacterium]|nr:DUF1232 domain-containing protein [Candidatus Neomarinimicrobiota bacterium]